uniref:Phosphoribulokinase/uridine kinase domain-containing protein n=1 Tax=Strigamia maritima TaxID=126957 RepID=T1IMZ9_STRMM
MENWIVVAISGVTCGGKTTLCQKLAAHLPSPVVVLNQDDYFLPEDSSKHVIIKELNHANWDIVSSVDFDKFLQDIQNILTAPPDKIPGILLLEGNLILNFSPIDQICNKKFYMVLNKEECWARRRLRVYQPPDPPGFFEICVWPMYEMYKKEIDESIQNVEYINGSDPVEDIYRNVYNSIAHCVQQYVASKS